MQLIFHLSKLVIWRSSWGRGFRSHRLEVCDSLAAEPVVLDLEAAAGGGPKMPKPTAFEPEAEFIALSSIIAASCDAVVFVDLMLTISKPAPTLATMLGFAGTMCGETLPMLPPHQDEETEKFLESLERLRPSRTPEAAARLPVLADGIGTPDPNPKHSVLCCY